MLLWCDGSINAATRFTLNSGGPACDGAASLSVMDFERHRHVSKSELIGYEVQFLLRVFIILVRLVGIPSDDQTLDRLIPPAIKSV